MVPGTKKTIHGMLIKNGLVPGYKDIFEVEFIAVLAVSAVVVSIGMITSRNR